MNRKPNLPKNTNKTTSAPSISSGLVRSSSLSNLNRTNTPHPSGSSDDDNTVEHDLLFNQHLQTLARKEIVKKQIEEQTKELDDQLIDQYLEKQRLKEIHTEMKKKILLVNEKKQFLEIGDEMESIIEKMEQNFIDYKTKQNLTDLYKLLEMKLNSLRLENVEAFKSQDDYDKFKQVLKELDNLLNKILGSIENRDKVHELALVAKKLNALMNEADKQMKEVDKLRSEVAAKNLEKLSDDLGKQYED